MSGKVSLSVAVFGHVHITGIECPIPSVDGMLNSTVLVAEGPKEALAFETGPASESHTGVSAR